MARRVDLLQFQIEEIGSAKLKPGEDVTLEHERLRLANAEKMSETGLWIIQRCLLGDEADMQTIVDAIAKHHDPNKKISLYVFGDEFSGEKMQQVVETVDRMNKAGPDGSRRVRIHAVGFPTVLNDPRGITGIRFATLMRVLCQKNGGTFVGLNTTRP
jgi:hypothetical protein